MTKKKVILNFPAQLWKMPNLSWSEKVIMAFRQVVPSQYLIELDKHFVRIYKCTTCAPTQHVFIGDFEELVAARDSDRQESFEIILDLATKILV